MNRYVYVHVFTDDVKEIHAKNRASAEMLLAWFYPVASFFYRLAYVD